MHACRDENDQVESLVIETPQQRRQPVDNEVSLRLDGAAAPQALYNRLSDPRFV